MEGQVGNWIRTTQSDNYRGRVKKAVRMVQGYRLAVHGSARLTGNQRDAIHYFLDTNTVDNDRRTRTSAPRAEDTGAPKAARDVLGSLGV